MNRPEPYESPRPTRRQASALINEVGELIESYRAAPLNCVQTTPGRLGAKVHCVVSPRVEVRDVAVRGGMVLTADDSFPRLGVGICVHGRMQALGSNLTNSNIGYVSGQNGMIARLEPGSRWCNMTFAWELVHRVAEIHGYNLCFGDHTRGIPVETHDALATFLSGVCRGLQCAELSDMELEDTLARTVLRALAADKSTKKLRAARHGRAVHRVVDLIRSEYVNPVTVTELCQVAGMGERSLEYLFRNATGFTMQQYLRNHRLQQARAMLLSGEYNAVGDVARACGIPHAGRFSQYYRQMFGQSPRETLAAR